MSATYKNYKFSSQKRIILSFLFVFFIAILIICLLMYRIFSNNLSENLNTRAFEVIDIIDYMAQTSGESPELIKGINTLAANRDIKLIIVRIDHPPVVIASNKAALIGLPTNEIFSNFENNQPFKFDADTDQFTAISSIWLENKFNNGQFTKASVGVVFDTYKTRILLQEQILKTSFYLILMTVFAIGLMYLLTNRYIFKPLEVINTSLIKNDIKNEFIPIPLSTHDEIGTVASTLNKLFIDLYTSKKTLRENTERYDLALQGTKVGLIDWNIEADTLYCSSSLMDILGVNTKEFSPSTKWLDDHTHEDDRMVARSALISHLKFNSEYDIEGRLQHDNGEYIWMRARGQAIRDNTGQAIRMLGYLIDISKSKANEHIMNTLYLTSLDTTTSLNIKINKIIKEALNYLNLSCGVIFKIENNKCITKYHQYQDTSRNFDEYKFNNHSTFELEDTLCKSAVKQNDIVALHNVAKSEFNNIRAHKQNGINSYIGIPINMNGIIYGTVSFFDKKIKNHPFEDHEKTLVKLISQWISTEMMRAQYIDFLHETEVKLENAVEELTKSNADLENFTYVASHDLQEPLRMITNFTGLLEKQYAKNLDDNAKEYLNITSKSASQMRELIKDLLEYVHANKINEKIETLDLNNILNHVYGNLEKQIQESNAKFFADTLPRIEANKSSTISLLQNLISNAIKFQSKNNQPVITITSTQYSDKWIIAIKDNGIGIAARYQSRIFEPFKQLHAKNVYDGTGIGLAICKNTVNNMNGKIWVESNEGCGSTFYLSIPNLFSQTGKAA